MGNLTIQGWYKERSAHNMTVADRKNWIRSLTYNMFTGSHRIRLIGELYPVVKYFLQKENGKNEVEILFDGEPVPEKASLFNKIISWCFIYTNSDNEMQLKLVEFTDRVIQQIKTIATKLGVQNPGSYRRGILCTLIKTGYGKDATFTITDIVINTLNIEEINLYNRAEPIDLILSGQERTYIEKKEIVTMYCSGCHLCNGNGYIYDNAKIKICEYCKGEGKIYI